VVFLSYKKREVTRPPVSSCAGVVLVSITVVLTLQLCSKQYFLFCNNHLRIINQNYSSVSCVYNNG